jgi:hypothetical protein
MWRSWIGLRGKADHQCNSQNLRQASCVDVAEQPAQTQAARLPRALFMEQMQQVGLQQVDLLCGS